MIARYISSEDGDISLKAEVKDLIKEKMIDSSCRGKRKSSLSL